MRHSTPKSVKILQKSQSSDNLTDKFDVKKTVTTQSHRVSWGPGVFDASLPVDEPACRYG